MSRTYRVGVIGRTGRGDYGHGLDAVWRDVPGTQVVAVADDDKLGLAAADYAGGLKGERPVTSSPASSAVRGKRPGVRALMNSRYRVRRTHLPKTLAFAQSQAERVCRRPSR